MIVHKKCDIFESGADFICHQVNCQGVMGSGIAKQIKDRYPEVYKAYKKTCNSEDPKNLLGRVEMLLTSEYPDSFGVINIYGQLNYGYDGKCYTDYNALQKAFSEINKYAAAIPRSKEEKTFAFPYKFGCARGGGDWNTVYNMIKETFTDCTIYICEYDKG